jgi:hypothetical protein
MFYKIRCYKNTIASKIWSLLNFDEEGTQIQVADEDKIGKLRNKIR